MNPLSQGTSSSPVDPPMKRKRGRPRKDESLVPGEKTPVMSESDNMKKNNQTLGTTGAAGVNMVGQVITGVIDGLFDAGYLVKVKVEDSDTHLSGLVFLPGRFTPVTAANDIAPLAKMYRREDIPIPASYNPNQLPTFVTPPEKSDKQPVELKTLIPTVQDKGLQSGFQPTVPIAKESLSASQMLPLTEYLQSRTGPSFGGKLVQHHVLGPGHENKSASAMAVEHQVLCPGHENQSTSASAMQHQVLAAGQENQSVSAMAVQHQVLASGHENKSATPMAEIGHNKSAGQHDLLEEFEASLRNGPNLNVKANEQSKSVLLPSPPPDILPGSKTATMVLEIKKQLSCDELKLNQLVHDEAKSPSSLMEKQASPTPKVDDPSEHAMKIINEDDTSHLNGSPIGHAASITEANSLSEPVLSFPSLLFEKEAIPSTLKHADEGIPPQIVIEPQSDISSGAANIMKAGVDTSATTTLASTLFRGEAILPESQAAADEPIPRMTEPQLCNSPGVANNVDSNIKDVIPPAES